MVLVMVMMVMMVILLVMIPYIASGGVYANKAAAAGCNKSNHNSHIISRRLFFNELRRKKGDKKG